MTLADRYPWGPHGSHSQGWLFCLFALVIMLGPIGGCAEGPAVLQLQGDTMGTTWHVTVVDAPADITSAELQQGIEVRLEAVNRSMSTYLAESEISRFNALGIGSWFDTSPDFFRVLTTALDVGRKSDGAYDITVAPLIALWGFGPNGDIEVLPEEDAIAAALTRVGQTRLELDQSRRSVMKQVDLSMDFSSLAKGYAVDKVAQWLADNEVNRFLVEVGGEMRMSGMSAREDLWRIAIEQPDSSTRSMAVALRLTDVAVATSGDYRNYFELDGQRFSHSIDPRTGYPVTHDLVSVTVVHAHAMLADAWATALIILGTERAMAVAEAQRLAVYFIHRTEEGYSHSNSSSFSAYLEQADLESGHSAGNET